LEQFLSEKGWDLLNAWFYHALKSGNYYLCRDLVKLFALCPMTAARLKDNAHQNQTNWRSFDLTMTENVTSDDLHDHINDFCVSHVI